MEFGAPGGNVIVIATRMVPPQPSIDPNDAMILPNDANPGRIEFSERTTGPIVHHSKNERGMSALGHSCRVGTPRTIAACPLCPQ